MKLKRPPPASPERIHVVHPPPGRLVRGIHVGRTLHQVVERRRHITPDPPLNIVDIQIHIRRPAPTPQVQRQRSAPWPGPAGRLDSTTKHDSFSSHCVCSFPRAPTAFFSPHSSPASQHLPAKYPRHSPAGTSPATRRRSPRQSATPRCSASASRSEEHTSELQSPM